MMSEELSGGSQMGGALQVMMSSGVSVWISGPSVSCCPGVSSVGVGACPRSGGGGMEGGRGGRGVKSRKTEVNTALLLLSIYLPFLFFLFSGEGRGGEGCRGGLVLALSPVPGPWSRSPVPGPGPVGSVSGGPLGASLSVCALVSDNNPNHFSPMLSPPARSGRYTTSAVFAS